MANGTLITDYLSFGSGTPGTPSLGDNSTEAALRLNTDLGQIEVWNGSAWVLVGPQLPDFYAWYPWATPSGSDWRASAGSTPGAWTLASGLTATYPPNGYALLTNPGDSTARVAYAAISGSAPFEAMFRIRLPEELYNALGGVAMGLGTATNGSDLSGFTMIGFNATHGLSNGSQIANTYSAGAMSGFWGWWWVTMDGTHLTLRYSPDGRTFDPFVTVANTTIPTHVLLSFNAGGLASTVPVQMWLDFIAFGNSTPRGQ